MKALTIIFFIFSLSFAKINTFEANFIQSIISPQNKTIKYLGKVYIKHPSSMLWQYKTPIVKNVYMNNKSIVVDEPQLEQAIYTTLTNEINLINFLNNPKLVDKKYKLFFKKNLISAIAYNDEMGNNINIKFVKILTNKNIPDQLFQFIAPLQYDVIRK
jgi:outer membrane lipoprotein carrier protein